MPVRDDMHRSCGAACRADQAQADARPRLILRKGVEPHVDPAIATAVQALDAACHMAVGQPFSRAAGRIVAGPFCVSTASAHAASKRHTKRLANNRFLVCLDLHELLRVVGALRNRNDKLGAEAQAVPVRTSHTRAIFLVRLDPSSDLNPDLGSLRFLRKEHIRKVDGAVAFPCPARTERPRLFR